MAGGTLGGGAPPPGPIPVKLVCEDCCPSAPEDAPGTLIVVAEDPDLFIADCARKRRAMSVYCRISR